VADDPIRPDPLAILTRPGRLDTDRADALLDSNPAERALAARMLMAEAAEVLAEAGVLRPGRTVMDLTLREASSLAAVLGCLGRWWQGPGLERHPLGDVLKVVPAEEAAHAVALLTWGDWLAEPPTADPEG
jgi:hypothetical protein